MRVRFTHVGLNDSTHLRSLRPPETAVAVKDGFVPFIYSLLAGYTPIIMKGMKIRVELLDAARVELLDARETSLLNFQPNNRGVINNVSYIKQNRKGSPSWVVRCLETGDIFSSQRAASEALGYSQADISRHLNGLKDSVDGLHFERICMAA